MRGVFLYMSRFTQGLSRSFCEAVKMMPASQVEFMTSYRDLRDHSPPRLRIAGMKEGTFRSRVLQHYEISLVYFCAMVHKNVSDFATEKLIISIPLLIII